MNMSEGRKIINLIEETVLKSKLNCEQKVKIALIDNDTFSFNSKCLNSLRLTEEFLIKNWELILKKTIYPNTKIDSKELIWIIKHSNLSEYFIENFLFPLKGFNINQLLNFHKGNKFTEEFIEKCLKKNKIFICNSFTRYLYNNCGGGLSVEFLSKHMDQISPWQYSQDPEAKLEIIEKFIEIGAKLDWFHLSLNMNMNKEFFIKHWENLYFEPLFIKSYPIKNFYNVRHDIKGVVEYSGQYPYIMEKYNKFLKRQDKFNNDELLVSNSYYYYLKENNKFSMDWVDICKNIVLCEAFIEELLEKSIIKKDCVDNIIKYQDISIEMKEKLEQLY